MLVIIPCTPAQTKQIISNYEYFADICHLLNITVKIIPLSGAGSLMEIDSLTYDISLLYNADSPRKSAKYNVRRGSMFNFLY